MYICLIDPTKIIHSVKKSKSCYFFLLVFHYFLYNNQNLCFHGIKLGRLMFANEIDIPQRPNNMDVYNINHRKAFNNE